MTEYSDKIRIYLIEYFVAMFIHVLYAFAVKGNEIGRLVILVSFLMLLINGISVAVIHKSNIIISIFSFTLLLSFTIISFLLKTLAYLSFWYIVGLILLIVFLEPVYVAIFSISASLILLLNGFIFRDLILINVTDIETYYLFFALFVIVFITLFLSVRTSKYYYKEMKSKAEEAEHATQSKEFFLSNMSHNIRSPMNAIYGLTELTLKEDLSSTALENVKSIRSSSKVLISIINDILDYTKMENKEMEIIPISYSFKELVNEVVNTAKSRMDDKEVEIITRFSSDIPYDFIGDEVRIRQILFNIISNAVKFTERGYILVETSGKFDGDFVDLVVSVTDTGIGINREDISKLFTVFNNVNSKNQHGKNSSGLGLAICKGLLNMMGGDISVESTYGVGSKFTFTLSQKLQKNKIANDVYSLESDSAKLSAKGNVLIVDDNAVNLKVAEGLLKSFGLDVSVAKSGTECLSILEHNSNYDIIFIDHMMPDMDGIETLKAIRAKGDEHLSKVPIIALTANVVNGIREMLISEGFDEYIAKPIDMIWLSSVLRKYLPKDKQL